jgi:3-hydroxy acid dehydrogenase / malonic semialdehyde reductase
MLKNKLALITGATAGIGEACARRFAAEGANLILWARRLDRLDTLADEIENAHGTRVHVARVDVCDREAVSLAAQAVLDTGDVPDILLNNAGLARGMSKIWEGDPDAWDEMIDTNVKGLLYVTRAFLPAMVERNRGHVINIGSTAGHTTYPNGNVYAATKFAVDALTQSTSLDLAGTAIRVTSIDPGFVETEFSYVRFSGDSERARKTYDGFTPLTGDDVAEAVVWAASRPAHVNIADMILMPTAQRNIFIVDRSGNN